MTSRPYSTRPHLPKLAATSSVQIDGNAILTAIAGFGGPYQAAPVSASIRVLTHLGGQLGTEAPALS